MKRRASSLEEPQINLTPLIDVVFVVLIMFIIIAPLLQMDRIQLAQAAANQALPVQEMSDLVIHLHADNTLSLNQQTISLELLSVRLTQYRQRNSQTRLQLYPDKNAHFGTYQSIKNVVEEVGFTEMDIILQPK